MYVARNFVIYKYPAVGILWKIKILHQEWPYQGFTELFIPLFTGSIYFAHDSVLCVMVAVFKRMKIMDNCFNSTKVHKKQYISLPFKYVLIVTQ